MSKLVPQAVAVPILDPIRKEAIAHRPRSRRLVPRVRIAWEKAIRRRVPPALDAESHRRARLIAGFGLLGSAFGAGFAVFYLAIGHLWGASIILVCSAAVTGVPFLMRATKSTRLCGNLLTLILLLGFASLCGIEGGVRGHAIAWLAAIPLCALLLVDGRTSLAWCLVCTLMTGAFVTLDWQGVALPVLYSARWQQAVTAAGYLCLTIFMCVLGLIFEGGRRLAFGKMERAYTSLSIANLRLKKADREKNEFLGIVAHDLKNPLTIVMGFAEMIAKDAAASGARSGEDARCILHAAERMIALITQLLDVNTIEQGHFPIELAPCNLVAISGEILATYAAAAAKKGIAVHGPPPSMTAQVLADSKAAYQVIDNLFSNAIKYSPPNAEIFVRIRPAPSGFAWEVQDQGAGLGEEDQAKLFQKFTRLSTRPTAGESSTGLGLSIVKMLSEAMGGTVECRSKPGGGSTFSLRLPTAVGK